MSLGVGIVGTGFIAGVHADAIRLTDAELVGVSGISEQTSNQFAIEHGAAQIFSSTEEMLKSDQIDVVHVCVPNHLHYSFAKAALESGKHVVCEKPLTINIEEAIELRDLAESNGLVTAVPFVYRYLPMVSEARAKIADGEIGPLRLFRGSYLQDWLSSPNAGGWRVDSRLSGPSRAFADIGLHLCDLFEWLSGDRIAEVLAEMSTVHSRRPVDSDTFSLASGSQSSDLAMVTVDTEDIACVLVRTDSGAIGTFEVSQVSNGRKNALQLSLDGVTASMEYSSMSPDRLWIGRPHQNVEILRDPEYLNNSTTRSNSRPAGHAVGYLESFSALFEDVYRGIAGRKVSRFPSFSDGVRAASIVDAVVASAHRRTWVKVSE